MLSRRPSTPDHHSGSPFDSGSLTDSSSSGRGETPSISAEDDPSFPSSDSDQRLSNDSDARPRPLSPGSIDVLGTLLSVAAAATAASLFSPSLGYQANSDSNSPPPTGIPRPMSPTPTAGLGGGEGYNSLPPFGLEPSAPHTQSAPVSPSTPREGRDRIRNVWETFRERLGLNRNASSSNVNEDTPTNTDETNMRPGEIMLAEMARALNIGLGLNGDGSSSTTPNPDATPAPTSESPRPTDSTSPARPMPSEDSFERFLLNLQADLRAALSDDGAGGAATSLSRDEREERESGVDDDAANSLLPIFDELPMRLADDDGDDDGMPPLQDVSDSEGEDEGEEIYEDNLSTRTPTPMPASTTVQPNRVDQSSSRTITGDSASNADRGPPGINLWRLYRFQPIPASQVAGHAATTTSPSTSPSPSVPPTTSSPAPYPDPPHQPLLAESQSSSPSVSSPSSLPIPSQDTGAGGADTTPAANPSTPAGDASSSMVVPVIVVGLQSVEMGQVHGHAHLPEPDVAPLDSYDAERRAASFDEGRRGAPPMDGPSTGAAAPRGRGSWQSRAATALRNLRPGRRNGSRERRAAESTGSRTFLIYVIGGEYHRYYPPNHHMVTGSDNLDSYEALWELAELLGQVKPPVATREDIDKSGLQVIQYSDLERYEQEGKVASNCVERCLICLDDYDTNDELRLMTCRHAFHKECVDRWLQVGRNNCPACRTTVSPIHACCPQAMLTCL
ncbi:hypothetical protein C8Q80DRAFT_1094074 [Daedaleopsis nitida]|nr:hypothetical protein C8Q80DRAFT_1094074 [Daedaleopsis nitida]